MQQPSGQRNFFVDEAGDLTLFNKSGAVILGKEGCSRTFMVGVATVQSIDNAERQLEELRRSLLSDPYFKSVPSMQHNGGKTALAFHAKDDLPEVRREVFRQLKTLGVQVQVAIRRKTELVSQARLSHQLGRKLQPNDVYDDLVKRLFKNLLHQGESNTVTFARRGKTDRQESLQTAIEKAKRNFRQAWQTTADSPTQVRSDVPSNSIGLQIVDYYLWALQRLFERGEDRYFAALASDFRLIMDLDDQRTKPYGRWYSKSDPLEISK